MAQIEYLFAVVRVCPEALRELVAIDPSNELAIASWARRRGFTDEWTKRNACGNAILWRELPETMLRWQLLTPEWEFVPRGVWEEDRETLDEFYARMKPIVRGTSQKDPRHFEWLARYQVAGELLETIAQNAGTDALNTSTVSEAIRETAKLCGVTLRRGRRGPRRKLRNETLNPSE